MASSGRWTTEKQECAKQTDCKVVPSKVGMHDWTEKTEMVKRQIEQAAGPQEETTLLSPGKVSDVQLVRGFLFRDSTLQC